MSPPYILKKKVFLIGIFGCSGVGKDTVGDYIERTYKDVYTVAFADALKFAAAHAFGIHCSSFYKPAYKIQTNPFWNLTPRQIGQFFGTELFRDKIQELIPGIENDFWIRRLAGAIDRELTSPQDTDEGLYLDDSDIVVITDGRFQNELDFVLANGSVAIHLNRDVTPVQGGISGHVSEKLELSPSVTHAPNNYWTVSNNSTLKDLYAKIANVLSFHSDKITRKSV